MKKLLLLVVILLAVSGCSSSKKKLVIYSPHGKEMLGEFEQQFEKVHPDIDVQWLDMGSQEVFDRVNTEKANPIADIWWGAPATMFMRAEKNGLLEPYKPTWADKVAAGSKSRTDGWYGTFLTPQVIAFNDKFLTNETAPKSFIEMTMPRWKDKVIFRNPMASGTMRAIFCSILESSLSNNKSDSVGKLMLNQLDANTAAYLADPTQMYIRLAADTAVTLWNMPDIVLQKNLYHYPFGYNFPEPATVVLTDGIAIIKGTKNPDAANAFYEFVTSEPSLILQADKFYRIPARTDIDKSKLPSWITGADYKTLDINWEVIAENESEWMKQWDTQIKGKNRPAN